MILPNEPDLHSHPIELNLAEILPQEGEFFWGRDDAWGLRLVRSNNTLRIFARMCHHEGASLDQQACVNHQIQCPWHGRLTLPIATFDLTQVVCQQADARLHQIRFTEGLIAITLRHEAFKSKMSIMTCVDKAELEEVWAPYAETD